MTSASPCACHELRPSYFSNAYVACQVTRLGLAGLAVVRRQSLHLGSRRTSAFYPQESSPHLMAEDRLWPQTVAD